MIKVSYVLFQKISGSEIVQQLNFLFHNSNFPKLSEKVDVKKRKFSKEILWYMGCNPDFKRCWFNAPLNIIAIIQVGTGQHVTWCCSLKKLWGNLGLNTCGFDTFLSNWIASRADILSHNKFDRELDRQSWRSDSWFRPRIERARRKLNRSRRKEKKMTNKNNTRKTIKDKPLLGIR